MVSFHEYTGYWVIQETHSLTMPPTYGDEKEEDMAHWSKFFRCLKMSTSSFSPVSVSSAPLAVPPTVPPSPVLIDARFVPSHKFYNITRRSGSKDHYQVLGVGKKATSGEIKDAFFTMSKKCHPDSDPTNPLLHSQFVRLNEAYRVLSRHSSRMEYDQVLEAIQRENWSSAGRSPYKSYSTTYNWKQAYQTEQGPFTRSSSEDHGRYWSEFPPKREWEEYTEDRQQRNYMLVLYCFLVVGLSIFIHYEIFSAFRDVRRKEMDDEQMKILKFYNERVEKAKMNGFNLQQEILMQRHEERLRRLYGRTLKDETRK